jgi:hypothetical protein
MLWQEGLPMTQPRPPKPNQRSSPRRAPKGTTRAQCYRSALGLGANLAVAVLDVSETGVRLVLKADLPLGQEIEVDLDRAAQRPVKALARIIWSLPTADGNFCVGARFHKPLPYADLSSLARS